ncbi:MAG TPA: porin family protein [Rhabdaerophilum sp.]|nr:porin family protein [Rhabdaerophilum sp.]
MKKFSIAAGIGFALLASAAVAADLPRKTAPVAPAFRAAPIFTWTGFYAGVNAGYGFGRPTGAGSGIWENTNGFVGGGQIGYNHQFNQFVVGLETDLQGSWMSGKQSGVGAAGDKSRIPYFGTVRARAGFAIDRFMPYVTGGFAYGGSHVVEAGVGKTNNVNYGWVVGGGVEYAFTNNITAKVEGLYVDLADKGVIGGTRKYGNEFGVVRAGLNYKF